ncbi:MAG: STAS domain-containing protein [Oscillibacter sp.]|nr:STAS domain-containing protein [Oscillibacter sp.]
MHTNLESGKLTIGLEGRIDSDNASRFEKDLFAAPDAAPVLDAEKLEYISSAGLRVLMKLRRRTT